MNKGLYKAMKKNLITLIQICKEILELYSARLVIYKGNSKLLNIKLVQKTKFHLLILNSLILGRQTFQ